MPIEIETTEILWSLQLSPSLSYTPAEIRDCARKKEIRQPENPHARTCPELWLVVATQPVADGWSGRGTVEHIYVLHASRESLGPHEAVGAQRIATLRFVGHNSVLQFHPL